MGKGQTLKCPPGMSEREGLVGQHQRTASICPEPGRGGRRKQPGRSRCDLLLNSEWLLCLASLNFHSFPCTEQTPSAMVSLGLSLACRGAGAQGWGQGVQGWGWREVTADALPLPLPLPDGERLVPRSALPGRARKDAVRTPLPSRGEEVRARKPHDGALTRGPHR